ncbi:hypothetical protein ACA910_021693 [Epithemia clementina (nom. ined.)]
MSWKAHISRHVPFLRFFACPQSPSSLGVMKWYTSNYDLITNLNPNMPFTMRTTENAAPAVVTELDWTIQDLLRFMIQTGRFRDMNGTISEARVEAAKAFLATDWDKMTIERFKSPGFDPEFPFIDEDKPEWRDDPQKQKDLGVYLSMKEQMKQQMDTFQSGPDDEWLKAESALLMCQRVDLWCAGSKEVERAVVHLIKLGRALNNLEAELPPFITDFYPGVDDMVP